MDPSLAIIKTCREALISISTDRGLLGRNNLITKLAMQFFREAMFKMEYWTDQGMPESIRWVSRFDKWHLFEYFFLGRHKFQHFGIWSQNQLLDFIWTILESGRSTSLDKYIDFKVVEKMFAEHRSGKKNFSNEIDKLVTLILAERQFLKADISAKSIEE
jgi:asparagine synthase (glutamine-hydrolysing)